MSSERKWGIAQQNLVERLERNPYPGRGIVIGTSEDGLHAVEVYWIMGRSENSRNRVFKYEGERLFTEAADPSKVKDPRLIIYNAMDEFASSFVVSNGDQTDTVVEALQLNEYVDLSNALCERQYEPDSPNFTPRITGMCMLIGGGEYSVEISLIRRSEFITDKDGYCERFYYEYGQILPGFGFCVTTYSGDGNPLPAFTGEPYPVPLEGDIDKVLSTYWSILNEENRVSLAVKFIDLFTRKSEIKVINRFSQVAK